MNTVSADRSEQAETLALPQICLPSGWATHFDPAEPAGASAPDWLAPLRAVLPAYLARQRWFAAKGQAIDRLDIVGQGLWQQRWLLLQVDVALRADARQSYWLPLAIAWDDRSASDEAPPPSRADVLARVRDDTRRGALIDAFADAPFCRALLAAMRGNARVGGCSGALEFSSTAACARLAGDDAQALMPRRASASSSNTALLFGERLFLKAYRRLAVGINPEVEMGRFLTDVSPYANIAPFAGALEYRRSDGTLCALAMLQGCVASQGDAWSHALAHLRALIDADPTQAAGNDDARRWAKLGRRTGELHRALAVTTGDPAFDPQPVGDEALRQWIAQTHGEAAHTLDQLESELGRLPTPLASSARRLLAAREKVLEHIRSLRPRRFSAQITRYHGDFHLGQVLVTGDDFVIIDFEGEPSRTLAERRSKHSPLRDVAGMLRSFNYAANSALGEALAGGVAAATQPALAAALAAWEARATTAFIDGYRAAVGDCPAYPDDPQAGAALLELFLIEKAFYELRYELSHRPDWLHVPLGGLTRLLLG